MKQHTDGFVQLSQVELHYEQWGDGPRVLICLHGTSLHGRVWERLAQAMPADFRVIGLDQRGHGDSQATPAGTYTVDFYHDDLVEFADKLGIDTFSIAGSSLGSRVALKYAATHVGRVDKIALLDLSFEMPREASDAMIHAHQTRPRTFADLDEALAFSRTLPQRRAFADPVHLETLKGDLRTRQDGRLEWRYDKAAAIETLSVAARDMWADVKAVEAEVLLLRGEHSDVLLPTALARMQSDFRHVEITTIEGAGHSIWGDNPEATTDALTEFLGRVPATSPVA
jgi:pimeloyl-ACP methyl ester carboxylesterase